MITVDTHIILWDALAPDKLSNRAKKELSRANRTDGMLISQISLWEIAMLIEKNRIKIDMPYCQFIDLILAANNCRLQGITPEIAELSAGFTNVINADPADRIISATSLICKAPLVTSDKNLLRAESVNTIW